MSKRNTTVEQRSRVSQEDTLAVETKNGRPRSACRQTGMVTDSETLAARFAANYTSAELKVLLHDAELELWAIAQVGTLGRTSDRSAWQHQADLVRLALNIKGQSATRTEPIQADRPTQMAEPAPAKGKCLSERVALSRPQGIRAAELLTARKGKVQ